MASFNSNDRRVPTIWEIASDAGKRVVVVNPLTIDPVHPVHGVLINLNATPKPGPAGSHPPEVAQRWGRQPIGYDQVSEDAAFEEHSRRLAEEVSFTIELLRENDFDLGVYYTHFVDTVSHFNWDFWARGDFLLLDLPRRLDDGGWRELVERHLDDLTFRAYEVMDAELDRLRRTFPAATLILVSDHGWTWSGYEHFGSPDGVVVIAGPGIRAGADLEDAEIRDIAPTVLARLGLPLSREFKGRSLDEAFETPRETGWVHSYVRRQEGDAADEGFEPDAAELERLRAIGYVQ